MRIEAIEIDDYVLDKIEAKHGISLAEAKQACFSWQRHMRRGREGVYIVFSRTEAGRYVLVALAHTGGGVFKIVTAREMTLAERRLYRKSRGG